MALGYKNCKVLVTNVDALSSAEGLFCLFFR
jgi:hypothetical protein